jgi:hypothetical protein
MKGSTIKREEKFPNGQENFEILFKIIAYFSNAYHYKNSLISIKCFIYFGNSYGHYIGMIEIKKFSKWPLNDMMYIPCFMKFLPRK